MKLKPEQTHTGEWIIETPNDVLGPYPTKEIAEEILEAYEPIETDWSHEDADRLI